MSVIEATMPKERSLLRSTSLVSVMTLISRLMGFARDMVIAWMFGAEAGMDAFFVAFRIPNFMRRLFAEGAFAQAFVPVLAEYQQTRPHQEVRLFMARVAGHLFAILSVVTIIGLLAAPLIIFLFAPGFSFDGGRGLLAAEMLRLTFPYLLLISMTAMAGAVLNTYGYFGVPAFTPVFLNIAMIMAAVYISPYSVPPVKALAWGVLIAGCLQLIFQLPFLYQKGLLVKPSFCRGDEGVRRVLKLMLPALFGVSIAQLNLLVDSIFASFLQVGSVSWLYYTDRLTDFPLGVFGVAIATVVLPHLSKRHASESKESFSRALDWGLRLLLLIGLPAAAGLAFFSLPVIATCFAYGKFTAFDLLMTQKSLVTLSMGIPAFMMVKVLASGFYAGQNIKTPVKVGAVAMLVNSLLCAILVWPMAHAGLTLASAIAGYVNCFLLLYLLLRRGIYKPCSGWLKYVFQLLFANVILIAYLIMIQADASYWLGLRIGWRMIYLLAYVVVAALLYFLCLFISGLRPAGFRGNFKESR